MEQYQWTVKERSAKDQRSGLVRAANPLAAPNWKVSEFRGGDTEPQAPGPGGEAKAPAAESTSRGGVLSKPRDRSPPVVFRYRVVPLGYSSAKPVRPTALTRSNPSPEFTGTEIQFPLNEAFR